MRSKKAEEFIGKAKIRYDIIAVDSCNHYLNIGSVNKAVEIAEEEMMEKAIEHYCHKCAGMEDCDVQPCTDLQEFTDLLK